MKRYILIFLSALGLTSLSTLFIGCFAIDQPASKFYECPNELEIRSLSCSDIKIAGDNKTNENEATRFEAKQAELLRRALISCDAKLKSNVTLPLLKYQTCQKEIIEAFQGLGQDECRVRFVQQARCILKKNIGKEVLLLFPPSSVNGAAVSPPAPVATSDISNPLDSDHLKTFFSDLGDWHRGSFVGIYKSDALRQVVKKQISAEKENPIDKSGENQMDLALIQELIDHDQEEVLDKFWAAALGNVKLDLILREKHDFIDLNAIYLQVAKQAIENKVNLPIPLQLQILGSSLKPFSQRLQTLANIADISCSIDNCKAYHDSELYRLIVLLGSIPELGRGTAQPATVSSHSDETEVKNELKEKLDSQIETIKNYPTEANGIDIRLRPFFQALISNARKLEAEIKNFANYYDLEKSNNGYRQDNKSFDILELSLTSLPRFARDIVGVIQSNRILRNSYLSSGLYTVPIPNQITYGFGESFTLVENLRQKSFEDLTNARDKFTEGRTKILDELIGKETSVAGPENRKKIELQKLEAEVLALESQRDGQWLRISQLNEDFNGLRSNLADDNRRSAANIKDAADTLNNVKYQKLHKNEVVTFENHDQPVLISPLDAPAISDIKSNSLSLLAKAGFKIAGLSAGQIALFTVQNNWSPTCALTKSDYNKDQVRGALTGPEGYMVTSTQGKAQVRSVSDYQRHDRIDSEGASASLCVEVDGGYHTMFFGGSSIKLEGCIAKSVQVSQSKGGSNDFTESTENRSNAAFNLGIRSEYTPFPTLPAGSLLIVQIKTGQSERNDILSIEIAHKDTTIVAQADVDVYLVVNDCRGEESNGLEVSYRLQSSKEGQDKELSKAMIAAVNAVLPDIENILSQGQVSPTQLSAIDAKIDANLSKVEGNPIQTLGQSALSDLYRSWKQNMLLSIEQKSRIKQLEREIAIELITLKRIYSDLSSAKAELEAVKKDQTLENINRLYELKITQALDDFDVNDLGNQLRQTARTLTKYVIPIYRFRNPNYLLTDTLRDPLKKLRNLSLSENISTLAVKVQDFGRAIALPEKSTEMDYPSWVLNHPIQLSFPNPAYVDRDPQEAENDEKAEDRKDDRSRKYNKLSNIPRASRAVSKGVWDVLNHLSSDPENEKANQVTFSIRPEDLYGNDGPRLKCVEASPVITSMMIYFAVNDEASLGKIGKNQSTFTTTLELSKKMYFPQEEGLETFEIIDSDQKNQIGRSSTSWRHPVIPVRFGLDSELDAVSKDVSQFGPKGPGDGLSPFMDFTMDFGAYGFVEGSNKETSHDLASLIHNGNIKEIIFAFDLKYRSSTVSSFEWLSSCAPSKK